MNKMKLVSLLAGILLLTGCCNTRQAYNEGFQAGFARGADEGSKHYGNMLKGMVEREYQNAR